MYEDEKPTHLEQNFVNTDLVKHEVDVNDDHHSPMIHKKTFRTSKIRWLALFLACSTNFGSYFCFDNPQALQSSIQKQIDIDGTEFNLLYSVYSFPNVILPFFGGIIIDKLGVRVALMTFAAFLIIGQTIVTIGVSNNSYATMIAGRVVFGLGGESLAVSQSSVTAKWFMGKELAFAMGVTLCVARLGSSLNSFLSPKINIWTGHLYMPFLVGVILCVVSWIGTILLSILDRKADEQEGLNKSSKAEESEKIRLQDLKEFNLLFYLLLFNCFFIYGAFFGLNNNINSIMHKRFGFSQNSAGNYIPIVYICSAVITPIFGLYTDKYGKRIFYMLIASIIFLGDHLLIAFLHDGTKEHPNYGMVGALLGVGLFYSTYAAVFWPCVPLVVKEHVIGTAYGIITALQNLMLSIIPLVIGAIHDNTKSVGHGYFWTEILLAGITFLGIIITTWIFIEDMRKGKRLHMPSRDRLTASKRSSGVSRSFSYH